MEPSNILKIDSLDENWRDKDSVMLHASFQLLKDCVEKENLLSGHTDWDADERHRIAKKKLKNYIIGGFRIKNPIFRIMKAMK